ncbi:mitogen-activated protein kinase kinase kinase 18 [Capsella rubella]|nr:mitogen-activated protein kinase kinase kinase 18 [Capsella rubella]
MEEMMRSELVSMSSYCRRYGHLKLHDFSNPSFKKTKYSPTKVFVVSSSSSNSTSPPPLPQNPIFQSFFFPVTPSPIIPYLQHCSRNTKKRKFTPSSSSGSVKVISREAFNAAVKKPSVAVKKPTVAVKKPTVAVKKPIVDVNKPTVAVTHDRGVRKSSSWVKSRLLGKGGYGSVYLATSKDGRYKTERAIKTAELSRASSLMDERRILKRLKSPFVIYCYGDEIVREGTSDCYNLILEYCSGQCLADVIEDNQGGLSEFDVKLYAKDVLSGLSYIHDRNIVHCDIKPDNLLLTPVDHRFRSNGFLTKIGDFGLAMEKGSVEYGNGCGHKRGTTRYMAPELIGHGVIDFAVDIWAFGCSVLEMLTGVQVWGEHGDLVYDDWVSLIGHSDLIPNIPSWLSEEAKDFLKRCFVKEPNARWGINELLNHPFLSSNQVFSHNGFIYE